MEFKIGLYECVEDIPPHVSYGPIPFEKGCCYAVVFANDVQVTFSIEPGALDTWCIDGIVDLRNYFRPFEEVYGV